MSMNPPSFRPDPDDADKALDQLLASYRVEPASAALRAQILRQAKPTWRHSIKAMLQALGGWRVLAPAMAFSLCLGLVVPLASPSATGVSSTTSDSVSLWDLAQLSETTEVTL